MRVFKNVLCYWLILPDTEVSVPDALEGIMTIILKLGRIGSFHEDYIVKKLGLSAYSVKFLFDRMENLDLVELNPEDNQYYLTEEGERSLSTEKIYFRKRVDLRVISINDPHFILTHHWNRPPKSDFKESPKITKDLLNQRRNFSYLNESISSINRNPEIVLTKERTLSFIFSESPPRNLTIEGDDRLQELEIKPNDPQIQEIHSSLIKHLNLETRKDFLSNLLIKNLEDLHLEALVLKTYNDCFEMHISLGKTKNSNNGIQLVLKWLNDNKWELNSQMRVKVFLLDDWYVYLPIMLKSNDPQLLHVMFCLYTISEEIIRDQQINTHDFLDLLSIAWEEFCSLLQVSETLDKNLVFDLWWELGAIGRHYAARTIEGEVLEND